MSEKCAGCGVSLDVRVGADLVTHQLDDGTKWHFCCLVEHERDALRAQVERLDKDKSGALIEVMRLKGRVAELEGDAENLRCGERAADAEIERLRTLLSTVRGALELARDSSAYETIRQAARDALSKLNATDGKGQQKYPSDARILDAQARNHKARMQSGANATDGDGDGED